MTEHLSSEEDLIEWVRKRARSRTQPTITTVLEDGQVVRKTKREKTIPPDPGVEPRYV